MGAVLLEREEVRGAEERQPGGLRASALAQRQLGECAAELLDDCVLPVDGLLLHLDAGSWARDGWNDANE